MSSMNTLNTNFQNRTINCLQPYNPHKEREYIREIDKHTLSQEVTQQINSTIRAIKQSFPHLCIQKIITSLYKTFILKSYHQQQGRPKTIEIVDSFQNSQQTKNHKVYTKDTNECIQNDTSLNLKYNQNASDNGDNSLRYQKKERTFSLVDFGQESLDNLKKIIEWTPFPNKQHRMIANKIAPKFNSLEEEVKYFEKRLAAKAFCQRKYTKATQDQLSVHSLKSNSSLYQRWRKQLKQFNDPEPDFVPIWGYGAPRKVYDYNTQRMEEGLIAQVTKHLLADGMDQIKDKRRYKTVSSALISQSYRRLQLFMMQNCGRKIRTVTGPEMRALYSILLNAQTIFKEQQYKTFQKIVKLTFDLGSVSIYEQSARQLYIRSQKCLRDRVDSLNGQSQINEQFLLKHKDFKMEISNQCINKTEQNTKSEDGRTLYAVPRNRKKSQYSFERCK